jgi:NADH-quinone oxidoreductase subunit L
MLVPVGILAALATVGGWLQWSPRWTPFTDWLAPAARTLDVAVPTNTQEYYTSAATVLAGLIGIGLAWALYSERRIKVPAAPFWRRTLENKFWFDALYDRVFYAPAVRVSALLRREFEEPVVLQTGTDLGQATMETGGLVRRIQTGLLRTYVLFLAAGAAGVVLAFLIAK